MDCEKFDKAALDLLYEELDELTGAAARRHVEHCSRCGAIFAQMRATRAVGVLPRLSPPADLQERILRMEREARTGLPFRERAGRAISVMAGYAMRPQLAMAALLLLMIGSSFLFLRSKPGDADSVRVTERGIQEADESVAIVPLPESASRRTPSPIPASKNEAPAAAEPEQKKVALADEASKASADGEVAESENDPFDEALSMYRKGQYKMAEEKFDAIASAGGPEAASASLYSAQSARNRAGCSEAARKFDDVQQANAGTNVGYEAAWDAATCYKELGQIDRARRHYESLLEVAAYAERAQHALDKLDSGLGTAVASRRAAAARPPAEAEAKTKPAAKPAAPASKPAAKPKADESTVPATSF